MHSFVYLKSTERVSVVPIMMFSKFINFPGNELVPNYLRGNLWKGGNLHLEIPLGIRTYKSPRMDKFPVKKYLCIKFPQQEGIWISCEFKDFPKPWPIRDFKIEDDILFLTTARELYGNSQEKTEFWSNFVNRKIWVGLLRRK